MASISDQATAESISIVEEHAETIIEMAREIKSELESMRSAGISDIDEFGNEEQRDRLAKLLSGIQNELESVSSFLPEKGLV